ncbi:MAG: branched-chain amino acid ABC transporter permease [Kiritimatiellae bacterium]|jgi:branched-chain amino acid transport system permease protein|nr:branched-chain amino acid ABC transporter permease [Kiritimatiellia bacterium]
MSLFLQLLSNGIIQGVMIACMAVGFGIVYRSFKIFHIALGAQFIFSCYAFYFFTSVFPLPLILAILMSIIFSIAFGILIEKAVYYPFYKKHCSSGVIMIASLGVLIITENLIALYFGNQVKTISNTLEPSVVFAWLRFTRIQLIQLFLGSGIFVAMGILVSKNKIFKTVWAMGDQAELIPVLGLPLLKIRMLIISVSAVMISVPALLISYDIGMDPHIGMHYLLLAAVAVFFGGTDKYWAWGIGAIVLSVLQSLTVWKFSARWIDLVTFAILIFVLMFRPQGLMGTRTRLEED